MIKKYRLLLAILLLALGLRLYHLNFPVADWHSWRQADTASVTREYVKHGIDLLHPTYHDLSNIPSGLENPQGYRMVEFPFINAGVAWLVRIFGFDLVVTSRLASILFSLGTLISIFFLVKKVSDERTAYLAALVFAILPYSVYYSRVILPEPAFLFFSTYAMMSFYLWLKDHKWYWYTTSVLALMAAFLLKPFVGFLLPVWGVLAYQELGLMTILNPWLYLYGVLSVIPFAWWRHWIAQFPEGIPASSWLFNSNGIRLRPAWFRWLFWERLTILFLGYAGVLAMPFNFLNRRKDLWVYGAWWVGIIGYFVLIATGNVQHDYYQNMALPIICISLARGLIALYDLLKDKLHMRREVRGGLCAAILLIGIYLAWIYRIKGYYQINHYEYVKAGQAADQLLPADAKVIAPAFGDTQFLFQTNRSGWPIGFEIDKKIAQGAQYYITTSLDDEAKQLQAKYTTVQQTPDYLILDLTKSLK